MRMRLDELRRIIREAFDASLPNDIKQELMDHFKSSYYKLSDSLIGKILDLIDQGRYTDLLKLPVQVPTVYRGFYAVPERTLKKWLKSIPSKTKSGMWIKADVSMMISAKGQTKSKSGQSSWTTSKSSARAFADGEAVASHMDLPAGTRLFQVVMSADPHDNTFILNPAKLVHVPEFAKFFAGVSVPMRETIAVGPVKIFELEYSEMDSEFNQPVPQIRDETKARYDYEVTIKFHANEEGEADVIDVPYDDMTSDEMRKELDDLAKKSGRSTVKVRRIGPSK